MPLPGKCFVSVFVFLKINRFHRSSGTCVFRPGAGIVRRQSGIKAGGPSAVIRVIRTAEEVFGCKLLSSTTGGRNGGGASLTPQAERLLSAYNAYVADLKAYADGKFEEAFGFYRTMDKA